VVAGQPLKVMMAGLLWLENKVEAFTVSANPPHGHPLCC
jgi:hypothetical protein